MSRFVRLGLVAACLLGLVVAGSVSAAQPTSERIDIDDVGLVDEGLSAECGVEVLVDGSGHIIFRTFTDRDGVPRGEVNNYDIHVRYYSEFGEFSVVDVGADRAEYLDDGSVILTIIGNVQSITAPGEGRVHSDAGWVRLLITFDGEGNASFEFLDAAGVHDEDATAAACAILNP